MKKDKNNFSKNICLSLTTLFIFSACSEKRADFQRKLLEEVKTETPTSLKVSSDPSILSESIHASPTLSPCEYWDDLPSAKGLGANVGETFQIFEELKLEQDPKQKGKFVLVGRHNLKRLPQVLYKMSSEASEKGIAKLNPPSLAEFMQKAEAEYNAKRLSWVRFKLLQTAFSAHLSGSTSAKAFLIKTRNDKFIENVEILAPGIFTGKNGPLANSLLISDLLKQSDAKVPVESLFTRLKKFQKEVALFPSGNWRDRQKDAEMQLAILSKTSTDINLPMTEKFCRFALAHRFQAQMLALKGFEGAPRIQASGLLVPVPTEDVAVFPHRIYKGTFDVVVNEAWIKDQVANPAARAENTTSSEDFLNALNYVTTITSYRNPLLWSSTPEKTDAGTVQINAQLLKLGMGFFAFTAKVLAKDELNLSVADRISLRNDSPEALTLLGHVAMNIAESFETLNEPNELERALLSEEDLLKFTTPRDGVIAQMDKLALGVVFEAFTRIDEGSGSDPMKQMIRRAGLRTNNPQWANLP